jgi:hypothetical protein
LRAEILTFRQSEKESIGAAWARLSSLAQSGPDLSLPNHLLLQHLYTGLSKENARYLDITAGGSFTHKTPAEGSKIRDKIMENIVAELPDLIWLKCANPHRKGNPG